MFDETACAHSELRTVIETALQEFLPVGELEPVVRYAVFSGGKRMRPMLTLLAAQACCRDAQRAVPAACAVELLHTASLIWDDMPCMDNAAQRRGVSSVHVMFGEARATLAALALLNQAYRIFSRHCGLTAEAAACVAEMIEGQTVDLQGCRERPSRKTTSLVRLTLTAGAIACGASDADVKVLARCGETIGEAYQIYDDFADGDSESNHGANELMAEAKLAMELQFGCRVIPLLSAVETILDHCEKQGVAA